MTAPDWVPAMQKALAIVTDAGGMTCHAAIVSREMGIPCIVGTASRSQEATASIEDGQEITVDASNGTVYAGIVKSMVSEAPAADAAPAAAAYVAPVTGTNIYMNLGNPISPRSWKLPCDGVGLMREEFIWTTFIHEHPMHLIETGRADEAVEKLAEGMRKVASALSPRQVVLRLSDFKSSEYRDLIGGDKYEPEEPSALLGWRGASRYYGSQVPCRPSSSSSKPSRRLRRVRLQEPPGHDSVLSHRPGGRDRHGHHGRGRPGAQC